ncbi:MAG TPA: alkaline phosphatase family protein [Mycobacteriales bacterium]|nr:alkaline phosphatase family protein [Mycobacteriales bacterium]
MTPYLTRSLNGRRLSRRGRWLSLAATAGVTLAMSAAGSGAANASVHGAFPARTATPIKHLVVIFGENISFDHYFGTYPHATNSDGQPFYARPGTPRVNGLETKAPGGGTLLTNNPNGANPQRLSPDNPQDVITCDQNHDYTPEQNAFDRGKADNFPNSVGTASGTSGSGRPCNADDDLDYYDGNTVTALWNYAQHFALSDDSFGTVYGPSTPGALDVVAGSTGDVGVTAGNPSVATASGNPTNAQLIANGKGGETLISDADPYYDDCGAHAQVSLTGTNIGDELNAKGLSWGWFEGGFAPSTPYSGPTAPAPYNPTTVVGRAVCGSSHPIGAAIGGTGQYGTESDYIAHHEPFQYYASTANPHHLAPTSLSVVGTDTQHYTNGQPDFDTANHQYDMSVFNNLLTAIDKGQLSPDHLPAVSYLKAPGYEDGHAGYSDPLDEQTFITTEINALERSPDWSSTAVVLSWDDSDGWYDHVEAPVNNPSDTVADTLTGTNQCGTGTPVAGEEGRCGPGPRLPLLVISPWARSNAVVNTESEQSSVVRFIEDNWYLPRIAKSADAISGSIDDMFDFSRFHRPNPPLFLDTSTGEPMATSPHHPWHRHLAAVGGSGSSTDGWALGGISLALILGVAIPVGWTASRRRHHPQPI